MKCKKVTRVSINTTHLWYCMETNTPVYKSEETHLKKEVHIFIILILKGMIYMYKLSVTS
jgi:hypothetical protein